MSGNPIYKNKKQVCRNIKVIRHYLELNKTEFAKNTGIGDRAMEFESGRFLPSIDEIKAIADLAEINQNWIIYNKIYTTLQVQ